MLICCDCKKELGPICSFDDTKFVEINVENINVLEKRQIATFKTCLRCNCGQYLAGKSKFNKCQNGDWIVSIYNLKAFDFSRYRFCNDKELTCKCGIVLGPIRVEDFNEYSVKIPKNLIKENDFFCPIFEDCYPKCNHPLKDLC